MSWIGGSMANEHGKYMLTWLYLVVFDQESDIVWMNQYYNCGDGVVTVGETVRDTGSFAGAC